MSFRTDLPRSLARVLEDLAASRTAGLAGLDHDSLDQLVALGVRVGAQAQLDADVELLSASAIRSALTPQTATWLRELDVRAHIDSTNTTLLDRSARDGVAGRVLTAEVQTAGRGRRGREWLSPFGRNLAVSIGADIDRQAAELGTLSLVVGVAVRDALLEYGLSDLELKWPNDVLMEGRKLAGILIELARPTRPAQVVIGIGVNVGCRAAIASRVDQAIADVADQVQRPSRNRLLAGIVNHVVAACRRFDAQGFAPFRPLWERAHRYRGKAVTVTLPASGGPVDTVSGIALGVGGDGALLVEMQHGVRQFIAGEVSLRPQSSDE